MATSGNRLSSKLAGASIGAAVLFGSLGLIAFLSDGSADSATAGSAATCADLADIAQTAMTYRQLEGDESKVAGQGSRAARRIVSRAFALPIEGDKDAKALAVRNFADSIKHECLNG